MAPQRRSKDEWVHGAIAALCDGGIDAVRVEPLARSLGVTKGSFYHHFENRRALHLAMLAWWEQLGTSTIIDDVDAASAEPVDRLRALIATAYGPDEAGHAIESAIRAWAASDEVAAEATRRVDERRVRYVADLLVAAGFERRRATRRSRLMYRHLIGEFIWRSSGGPPSSKRELEEMAELLLAR